MRKLSKNPKTVKARHKRWVKGGGDVIDRPLKPENHVRFAVPFLPTVVADPTSRNAVTKQEYFPPPRKTRMKKEPKTSTSQQQPDFDFAREPETVEPVQVSSAAASKSDKYRTTIFLTAQQREALKVMSAKTGNAVACLIRNAIDTLLKESL
jgi:hypothetical protein